MLAVVFPPFAQRLENSVSRACWPGSMSLGVFHSSHGLCYCSRLYGQANGEQIWDPEGANHVPTSPFTGWPDKRMYELRVGGSFKWQNRGSVSLWGWGYAFS